MNFSRTSVFALILATTCACAPSTSAERAMPKPSPETAQNISGLAFQTLKSEVTATGRIETIYAQTPLEEIESSHHFRFQFELAPGGSISLFANARISKETSNFERGVELEISRSLDPASAAVMVIARASCQERDWSAHFPKIDARALMTLGFDVHNDHGDRTHILAWSGDEHDPMFNSGSRHVGGSPGRGFGNIWGFRLNEAKLHAVAVDHPRNEH